jgi:hypothetical protein
MTYVPEQLRERLADSSGGPGAGGCTPPADAAKGRPLPVAADTHRLRQDPLADTAGPRDRTVGRHPGHRTPPQPSVGRTRTRSQAAADTTADRLATALRNTAAVAHLRAAVSGPVPEPARLWPAEAAVPDRVRPRRTSAMSAVAAPRTTGVHAGGRRAVGGRTPVRAQDRRRHQDGHRHQPGHVCRTPAVRRAVVPEAADGQSADRSQLVTTSSPRPASRCGTRQSRTPPMPSSPQTIMAHGGEMAPIGSAAQGGYCAAA